MRREGVVDSHKGEKRNEKWAATGREEGEGSTKTSDTKDRKEGGGAGSHKKEKREEKRASTRTKEK